jgi:RHS repeat-associated protein
VELSYVHNNYSGSAVLLTNAQASTTETIRTDAWGERIQDTVDKNVVIPTDRGYTGHKFDAQSDLTYAHARYLSNQNKIFLSEDPMALEGFASEKFLLDPQAQNSYAYARNNPVNFVDPDGKWWAEFFSGKQSWGGDNGLQMEIGQAAMYLSDNSRAWKNSMDYWYVPAVVGTAPLAVYGSVVAFPVVSASITGTITYVSSQISVGQNLAKINDLPMLYRVTNITNKGFDAIQKATGLKPVEVMSKVSQIGKSFIDNRNAGNINNIFQAGNKMVRVTTNPEANLIISAGIMEVKSYLGYVSSGAMQGISTIAKAAKAITSFMSGLIK